MGAAGHVEVLDGAPARLRMVGDVDLSLDRHLAAVLGAVAGTREVEVDASGVTFLDSSGLRFLLQLARSRRVVLVDPAECVEVVLRMAGAAHLLDVVHRPSAGA